MSGRYEPPSAFLRAVIDEEAPLAGSEQADANLIRLIEMMGDAHVANRDWATFLLAQEEADTADIRNALAAAAADENEYVRAEAILGLSRRDRILALPFIQAELRREFVAVPLLEAAAIVADPSLIDDLRRFTQDSGNTFIDELAVEALQACEAQGGSSKLESP